MTDREIMQQALDALEVLNGAKTVDGIFIYTTDEIFALRQALAQPEQDKLLVDLIQEQRAEIDRLRHALAQPEQEEPLPLVDIGVDVTPEGTHVVACYNRPDAVQEMFYSQFHPLAKLDQSKYSDIVSDGGLDPRNKFDAQPEPVQVRPHEFIAMASKQANMIGKPVVWAEYPTPHKIILDEGWEWGHEARAKEALAQPEQEPVAQIRIKNGYWIDTPRSAKVKSLPDGLHDLYTAPPKPEPKSISTNEHLCAMLRQVHDVLACTALPMKRKWVGLTDDEIEDTWGNTPMMLNARDGGARRVFARAIEAKLKEKNT
jgi:hypothetical protein